MASPACVLCFLVLVKASDRNLVRNKGEFLEKSEIDDLHLVVHPTSQDICHVCLSILQQRRNHKKKLHDLDDNLLRQYRDKAGAKGLAIKTKVTAKRSLSFVDESEDPSTSSGQRINRKDKSTTRSPTAIHFQPTSTSAPQRPKPHHEVYIFQLHKLPLYRLMFSGKAKQPLGFCLMI